MAIKARETITVSKERDVSATWRFYRIAASTSTPSQPTEAQGKSYVSNKTVPSGWSISEPAYDGTSTNSLYTCDLTSFTDGGVSWSVVSKSSSYEAAKQAYNEAQNAKKTATNFMAADELGVMVADMRNGSGQTPSNPSGRNVLIGSDSIEIRDGSDVLARFGEEVKIGQDGGNQMRISSEKLELETGDGITMVDVDSGERTAAVGASDLAHMTFDGYKMHIESSVEGSTAFEALTNPRTETQIYEQTLINWSAASTIQLVKLYNYGFDAKANTGVMEILSAHTVIHIEFSNGKTLDVDEDIEAVHSDGMIKIPSGQSVFQIGQMGVPVCRVTITVTYRSGDSSAYSVGFSNGRMRINWDGIPSFCNPDGRFGTVFDLIYPVGSIYMSVSSTSPATLFGGTWERVRDRFLLAAGSNYAAGNTGGSDTMTADMLPSHAHLFSGNTAAESGHKHPFDNDNTCVLTLALSGDGITRKTIKQGTGSSITNVVRSEDNPIYRQKAALSTGHIHGFSGTTGTTGKGTSGNNMPPYLSVYIWRRTA
ncbi:hypothetical protein BHK98_02480 [Hornefia porci]|uniref:Baseplate structural protein Gp10 C-terminal domain-containing protein n=1 Tax=Hornefia porci TaxID=2652292 RepID=A0A1Q9JFR0_9FIRM|nr:hypothetical protein [Hornefia porci]OLR55029.1 hypothetical protein BHK98_02480 [Hornefia porci]